MWLKCCVSIGIWVSLLKTHLSFDITIRLDNLAHNPCSSEVQNGSLKLSFCSLYFSPIKSLCVFCLLKSNNGSKGLCAACCLVIESFNHRMEWPGLKRPTMTI